MSFQNQRPGVYSRYDVTSAYTSPRSAGYAAVAAKAVLAGAEVGKVYPVTGTAGLRELFAADDADSALFGCVDILLRSGVSRVLAVAIGDDGCGEALARLEQEENVSAVICDCGSDEDRALLRESVLRSADALRERVAYCGADSADAAIAAAEALNCERVVLCCPAVETEGCAGAKSAYAAAALAGLVLAQNDCAYGFNGEPVATVCSAVRMAEADIQAALAAGVTVLEEREGQIECVRALTTRTKTSSEIDYSLRSLNTVLCIDDVMRTVRAALKATLRGSRLSGRSTETVRSQVVVALAGRLDAGVIESYEAPRVYADSSDPTVCVVELAFHIAHVVSQIHVTAHIQV